jgi:hypothetical protein
MTGVVYPTANLDRVWDDHGHPIAKILSTWWEKNIFRWGSSAKNGFLEGAKAGIQYVLNLQHQVDNLPVGELLTELRKHEGSIYWPLYSADPKFWAPCPRCHTTVLVDVEGICSECTYEIQEND